MCWKTTTEARDTSFFLQAPPGLSLPVLVKTTSHELGKVLQWAVFLTIVFTLILTARSLLSPDSAGADLAASAGSAGTLSENSRNSSFLRISILVMQLLIINYSVWQMIKRPWWGVASSWNRWHPVKRISLRHGPGSVPVLHHIPNLQKMVLLPSGSRPRSAIALAALLCGHFLICAGELCSLRSR